MTFIIMLPLVSACASVKPPTTITTYDTSVSQQGLYRKQSGETIKYSDPNFEGHVCLPQDQWAGIESTLLQCFKQKCY